MDFRVLGELERHFRAFVLLVQPIRCAKVDLRHLCDGFAKLEQHFRAFAALVQRLCCAKAELRA